MNKIIDILLDNLMSHYQVATISDLASKMDISQQTISAWKSRNSINAIKKKCRELGIFDKIFHDINIQSIQTINGGQTAQNVGNNQVTSRETDHTDIDKATFELIKETYQNAKKYDKLNEFRIYIMSFNV